MSEWCKGYLWGLGTFAAVLVIAQVAFGIACSEPMTKWRRR